MQRAFLKPNMANLHGRMEQKILGVLRQQTAKSNDNVRKRAEDGKARIWTGNVQ